MLASSIDQSLARAIQYQRDSRLADAEPLYREILSVAPTHPDALHLLGLISLQYGRHDAAVDLISRAVHQQPDCAVFYASLGQAHRAAGQLDQAINAYRTAMALAPSNAETHYLLGIALFAARDHSAALTSFRTAIQLNPHNSAAHNNLGVVLADQGHFDQAIPAYRTAILLKPDHAEAHSNLSIALRHTHQFEEAMIACRTAIRLKPTCAEAHNNLGNLFTAQGNTAEALAAYQSAVQLNPNFADAHWNLACTHLRMGDYAQGWPEYEWRWKVKQFPSPPRNFTQPQWDGRDLAGQTILLHAEQGFGDTLQFIRYAPLVAQRGGKVIVECQPELHRLLMHNANDGANDGANDWKVIAKGESLPEFDLHCPLLSLPLALTKKEPAIPADVPYVRADRNLTTKWTERLHQNAPKLKVGLAWAGSASHKSDCSRSLSLAQFAPLSAVQNASFYGLQKGNAASQLSNPPPGLLITDWTAELNDFADTAALIANLDLVITADTAVAHLAAAMGKPTWLLLPFAPDWRWLLDRADSPWYPSMRLFRQTQIGDWPHVVDQVAAALHALAADASR